MKTGGTRMNYKSLVTTVCMAILLGGCATKRYGRMQTVTGPETSAYSCKDIKVELSKVDAFELQVAEGAEFSALSVASFLGDLGIGNTIEKNAALKTAKQRRVQLNNLAAAQECP